MKKKKKSQTQTREKILRVAKKVFARKGFDGARVDEIAQKAKVNKALIYYYFKSKEEILEEIMKQFLEESLDRKGSLVERQRKKEPKKQVGPKELIESFAEGIFNLFKGNEDVLRIIITEELKSEKKQWPLFQLLDMGLKDGLAMAQDIGISIKKKDQLVRAAFYFGFIPIAFFNLLKDEWACYYKTDKNKDQKEFIEILKKTYIRYLLEEFLEKPKK
ncbi:MAG TPA: TetR/AcrR family transcriptional regulator [Acidobacteriota bacterium]|nr:TetR/AcrR family transcriptional regulator [Acidobacteriota bacterium]